MALPILVQKNEGPSVSPADPAVYLCDLDSDWRAKTETELLLVLCRFAESLVTDGMTTCLMTWYSERLA